MQDGDEFIDIKALARVPNVHSSPDDGSTVVGGRFLRDEN